VASAGGWPGKDAKNRTPLIGSRTFDPSGLRLIFEYFRDSLREVSFDSRYITSKKEAS